MSWSKRLIDIIIASIALVILSPILLISALAIRLTSPGPILFQQTRIGLRERPFTIYKLRTMHVTADPELQRDFNTRELRGEKPVTTDSVYKLENDPRITWVGKYLRAYSIDEFPQLINVLRGDMSLVGPRPALPWEVDLFSAEHRRRHQCLPGITGLWQVSGRNNLSMLEMLSLDVDYVAKRSLWLDLWILLRTPYVVFFEKGVR
jgi:lipopolysaccharide/colanic/teichoic acid biosynthesis glycosyltransferase